MTEMTLLSEALISPFFPLSYGIPLVDDPVARQRFACKP